MKWIFRNKNFYLMMFMDGVLIVFAYICAYWLRFDGLIPPDQRTYIWNLLPLIVPLKLSVFWIFNLYGGMWRYTSFIDLKNVLKATSFSSLVLVVLILYLYRFQGFPRSVYLIDWLLTFVFISSLRVLIRLIFERHFAFFWVLNRSTSSHAKKILIIGAGNTGEKVLKEIQENASIPDQPIGFLDDDVQRQGRYIHGVPVLGTVGDIEKYQHEFDEIIIAIPSAKGSEMRRIVDMCEKTKKRFRTVPSFDELIQGKISVKRLRNVTLEDLLGREQVSLNEDAIRDYLKDKNVLITGAGGSIGTELVRQVCRFSPLAVGILDFSEYNLYRIEMESRQRFSSVIVSSFLVDIKNRRALEKVFRDSCPDVVFHAAAYKHVPLQELNPWETVYNNVMGTRNLIEISSKHKIERFVLVSTDKAVRPTNVMGATKRVAEIMVENMNGRGQTRFMAVRFGNVMGSSGSAIPLFQEQISRGGPVTVTHPEITRYFMSIPEAAQLILQAGAMGEGSDIFILDMGKAIKILDMVRDLIRLNGLDPDTDVPIEFIGLRPGEKLYEELITDGEGIVPTNHEKILVLRGKSRCEYNILDMQIKSLLVAAGQFDHSAIIKKLCEIVKEYKPRDYSM